MLDLNTATDNLIQSKKKLETIVSMLRRAVGLSLEEGALMGFIDMLDGVKQDIDNMLNAVEDGDEEESTENWAQYNELNNLYRQTYAENLKLKKELAELKAAGGGKADCEAIAEAKTAAKSVTDYQSCLLRDC